MTPRIHGSWVKCHVSLGAMCSHASFKRWSFLSDPRVEQMFAFMTSHWTRSIMQKCPWHRHNYCPLNPLGATHHPSALLRSALVTTRTTARTTTPPPLRRTARHSPPPPSHPHPSTARTMTTLRSACQAYPLCNQDHDTPPTLLKTAGNDPYFRPSATGDGGFQVIGLIRM
jgi:hypothetical protein